MNLEALERVADLLEGKGPYANQGPVPEEVFNMGQWRCGSQGCACGWAASDKWFFDQGFTLHSKGQTALYDDDDRLIEDENGEPLQGEHFEVHYERVDESDSYDADGIRHTRQIKCTYEGLAAAQKFFGIDEASAERLFGGNSSYGTYRAKTDQVAKRIRLFVDYHRELGDS